MHCQGKPHWPRVVKTEAGGGIHEDVAPHLSMPAFPEGMDGTPLHEARTQELTRGNPHWRRAPDNADPRGDRPYFTEEDTGFKRMDKLTGPPRECMTSQPGNAHGISTGSQPRSPRKGRIGSSCTEGHPTLCDQGTPGGQGKPP